ncbi:MAG: tandem-95 repeat protein, partial [Myxococcales bacterium]|nr:tandem-95 repeat protein [Myxococcales bacterium]
WDVLLLDDSDVDNDHDDLVITGLSAMVSGSATLDVGQREIEWTPSANFPGSGATGNARFDYTVSDGSGGTDVARVRIIVTQVNDPPVGAPDTVSFSEDALNEPIPGRYRVAFSTLIANDTDVDDATLLLDGYSGSCVEGCSISAITLSGQTYLDIIPEQDYFGTTSFWYRVADDDHGVDQVTVTVEISPVNDTPVPEDDTVNAAEDVTRVISWDELLANDRDVEDGNSLTIVSVSAPSTGQLGQPDSDTETITYTPPADYAGDVTFTYVVEDSEGATGQAQVTMNVSGTNDPPVASLDIISSWEGQSNVLEDTTYDIPWSVMLANDSDNETANQDLVISAVNALYGCTVSINGESVQFRGTANFPGTSSSTYAYFRYTLMDEDGATATTTAYVRVRNVNDPPVAGDDSLPADWSGVSRLDEDTVIYIPWSVLLADDTDIETSNANLTISAVGKPINGTVSLDVANKRVIFTPSANFPGSATTGIASFSYTVRDTAIGVSSYEEDSALVQLTISDVNDPPIANNDTVNGTEDVATTLTFAALVGGASPDSDVDSPQSGWKITFTNEQTCNVVASTLQQGGSTTITCPTKFNGTDTFDYVLEDGEGGSDTATVTLNIAAVNDAPVLTGITVTPIDPRPGSTLTCSATGSDVDNTSGQLTYSYRWLRGSTVLSSSSSLSYTQTAAGQTIRCEATVRDPGNLTDVDSEYRDIENSPLIGFGPGVTGVAGPSATHPPASAAGYVSSIIDMRGLGLDAGTAHIEIPILYCSNCQTSVMVHAGALIDQYSGCPASYVGNPVDNYSLASLQGCVGGNGFDSEHGVDTDYSQGMQRLDEVLADIQGTVGVDGLNGYLIIHLQAMQGGRSGDMNKLAERAHT